MKPLCIYHGNCADGFGAAWAVREALGAEHVDFHAGVYQNAPPDVQGRDVIMVDFSYKRPVLDEMVRKARTVLVLDHHETAAEDLAGLPPPLQGPYNPDEMRWWADANNGPPLYALFDTERSGAGLTWDYFHPGRPRPRLIDHIEDRDLWRFKLEGTREIQAALFSYPYDFTVWSALVETVEADPERLICEGAAIERKHHKDIAELVRVVTRPMKFRAPWLDGPAPADLGFVVVPMANLPYTLTSDAGHLLCGDEHPFAGCFWFTPEGWVFSLRSKEGGADVGEIAKQYGGGGHRHAAGFRIPLNKLGEFCEAVNPGLPCSRCGK